MTARSTSPRSTRPPRRPSTSSRRTATRRSTAKEIGKRIGKKEFSAADPDEDGTITKDEYLAYAASLFKEADKDNEGTLDAKELKSKPGKALLQLMR